VQRSICNAKITYCQILDLARQLAQAAQEKDKKGEDVG
jgi:hypothetical protein